MAEDKYLHRWVSTTPKYQTTLYKCGVFNAFDRDVGNGVVHMVEVEAVEVLQKEVKELEDVLIDVCMKNGFTDQARTLLRKRKKQK